MRFFFNSLFSLLLFVGYAQNQPTVYKNSDWLDYTSYTLGTPIKEPSEVLFYKDSVVVHLGAKTFKYRLLNVTLEKNGSTHYIVESEGKKSFIGMFSLSRDRQHRERLNMYLEVEKGKWTWGMIVYHDNITGPDSPASKKAAIEAEKSAVNAAALDELKKQIIGKFQLKAFFVESYMKADLTKCKKDEQFEFFPDGSGVYYVGQNVPDCKKSQTPFKWKIRQLIDKNQTKNILIVAIDAIDFKEYQIVQLDSKRLDLLGDFNLGGEDTTHEGKILFSRIKTDKK